MASALVRTVTTQISAAFEGARDPAAAPAMKAYMKHQFEFLGIGSTRRVELSREATADLARPTPNDLDTLARAMWRKREREYQYFACWYLRRNVQVLGPDFLDTAHHLLTTKSWWDTVDELAQNIVGPIVLADRDLVATMDEWVRSDNLWLARTAILHQNRFKDRTDTDRLFDYCEQRAADTDFFLRKAIGWALREYTKTDAKAVRRFVKAHDAELSGLSKREALKWLDRKAARGEKVA